MSCWMMLQTNEPDDASLFQILKNYSKDDALPMEIRVVYQGEEIRRRVYSN